MWCGVGQGCVQVYGVGGGGEKYLNFPDSIRD